MLSTPTKHALRALLELATYDDSGFVSVETLAENADIPQPYLSKIVKVLANHGLVETKRGVRGGVKLARTSISFLEVAEAFQDPLLFDQCLLSSKACQKDEPCPFHEYWSSERGKIRTFLESTKVRADS